MYKIAFTPAEVLALATDLLADTRPKVGPRLNAAQKVVDQARVILDGNEWGDE